MSDGESSQMNIQQVLQYLPHRYPFLLIDRVIDLTVGESVVAIKNVTINEPYFPGHFPGRPVMPGVMILEALAQAAGILAFKTMQCGPDPKTIFYFVGIDKARFKRPVVPGDQLTLHITMQRSLKGVFKFEAEARVEGALACTSELMCAYREVSDD